MTQNKDTQREVINNTCCICSTRQFVKIFVILMSVTLLVFIADSYLESGILTQFIPVALNIQDITGIFPSALHLQKNVTIVTTLIPSSQSSSPSTPNSPSQTSSSYSTSTPNPPSQTSSSYSTSTAFSSNQSGLNSPPITTYNRNGSSANSSCTETPFVLCSHSAAPNSSVANVTFGVALLRRPAWMSHMDFSHCGYTNCAYHREEINESTHMVVVYSVGLNDNFKPPKRWPHQLYAASSWESPVHTHASFLSDQKSIWNSAFNITATYRVDSELFLPYGKLLYQPKPLDQRPNYYEIAKNKTKMAAWFVSNCGTPSRRKEYVKQMQKVIDIDIYGGCGKPCPESGAMCSPEIPVNYRFYLSFENSLCTDYVTEKFFKNFDQNFHIIPVVRGALDYNKYMPVGTFINAANFKSATELAQHLKDLANDNVAYSKYLENKHSYTYMNTMSLSCEVCRYLNSENKVSKVYDMKTWMGDGHCRSPSDL